MYRGLRTYQKILTNRHFSTSSLRRILSKGFELNEEWKNRHYALKQLKLGGDYEWIAAVQKKFVGGGKASAVDVDAATCLSEESDQLNDIIELIYKLRHTENAADLFPSTEYALYRLFLKHNAIEELFKIINDPINYGIFPNYHAICLILSYFLKNENLPAAAKIASVLVQQEMFDDTFVNLLAMYSLVKFCELPINERIFDDIVQKRVVEIDEDDINEEELRTMKFPFLKNRYFDDHFDLVETEALVGKSLEWLSRELKTVLDQCTLNSVEFLALLLRGNYVQLDKFLSIGAELNFGVIPIAKSHLEALIAKLPEEGREESEEFKQFSSLITKLDTCPVSEVNLSSALLTKLREVQPEGEKQLMQNQKQLFDDWNKQREDYVKMQTRRVELRNQIENINADLKKLEDEKEVLFFFEKRVTWEDEAAEKDKLFEEFNLDKKDETVTEAEYAKNMFEQAIKRKQKATG